MLPKKLRDSLLLDLDDAALAENMDYDLLFHNVRLDEAVDELDVAVNGLRKVQRQVRVALKAEAFTHQDSVTVTEGEA